MLHLNRFTKICGQCFSTFLTMKNLCIIYFSWSFLTFTVNCASVEKSAKVVDNFNDTLIPSDSLFSEEDQYEATPATEKYRQFLSYQPKRFQTFQNPNMAFQHSGQFPFMAYPNQHQYLDPQVQQHVQQQHSYIGQNLNPNREQSPSGSSKRKKDKQGQNGTSKRRKRPQKIDKDNDFNAFGNIGEGGEPDFSQITGYQVQLPETSSGGTRRKKRPQKVQEDYDTDSGIFPPYLNELPETTALGPTHSVKKQLKKNNFSDETTDLANPNTKAIEADEERSCPGCLAAGCNTNNVISGLPFIQIAAAITAGVVWAGIFLFLYKNFIAGGKAGESGGYGYGYSPAPTPEYGPPPASEYGPPPSPAYGPPPSPAYGPPPSPAYGPPPSPAYGPPPSPAYGPPPSPAYGPPPSPAYGPPPSPAYGPPPSPAYGPPTSSGYISYPTGRKSSSMLDSLSGKVWNAVDNFSKDYLDDGNSDQNKLKDI